MSRRLAITFAGLAAVAFIVALFVYRSGSASDVELPAGAAASVDGDVVDAQDVKAIRAGLAEQMGGEDRIRELCEKDSDPQACSKARKSLDVGAATQAVFNLQILGEVKRRGWKITPADRRAAARDPLVRVLTGAARERQLNVAAAAQPLNRHLYGGKVRVTPKEVFALYQRRRADYQRPERRSFQSVVLDSRQQARSVRRQIKSGMSFSSAVVKYNALDTRAVGTDGIREQVLRRDLPKPLADAVFSARQGSIDPDMPPGVPATYRPGPVMGPVQGKPGQWYVFRVTLITPPVNVTYKQAYQKLRDELITVRKGQLSDRATREFRDYWKARTACSGDVASDYCSNSAAPN